MAHKKAAGGTKLGRDSQSKRLGIKLFEGEFASPGSIIVRQRGTKYIAGENTSLGKDHTIFAVTKGLVKFKKKMLPNFTGNKKRKTIINIAPIK